MDNNDIRQGLKKRASAVIIHAKVVLLFLSFLSLFNLISILYLMNDTFIPSYYYLRPAISSVILFIPGIFCFKFPKTAFILGGIIISIVALQNLAYNNYLSLLIYAYILVAILLGYKAIKAKEKTGPIPEQSDDILDSGLF